MDLLFLWVLLVVLLKWLLSLDEPKEKSGQFSGNKGMNVPVGRRTKQMGVRVGTGQKIKPAVHILGCLFDSAAASTSSFLTRRSLIVKRIEVAGGG